MISNRYSSARMWALTKRCAVENRRNIAITLGVIFGLLLLVSILLTKSSVHTLRQEERTVIQWFIYAWCAALITQILGSLTFSSMTTKTKRISALMLPAKQSEKFVSQCLLYVVGGNLAMILCLLFADTFSSLIFGVTPGWYFIPKTMLSKTIVTDHLTVQFASVVALMVLWFYLLGQAIYVLGSAWWPRKSFLKTFVAILALQIILPIIIPFSVFGNPFDSFGNWLTSHYDAPVWQVTTIVYSVVLVAYALLAGIYYLAWRRYKSLEVVKRFLS